MTRKALVENLFVHDVKVPLAVIDIGVRSFAAASKGRPSLYPDSAGLLDDILGLKKQAVSTLNRILEKEPPAKTDPLEFIKRAWRRCVKRCRRFDRSPLSPLPSEQALSSLTELTSILAALAGKIDALQSDAHRRGLLTPRRVKVTRRMLRNARLAVHLVENARHLAGTGEAALEPSACKVATIVKRALVDVFDVMDTSISERLPAATTLSDTKATLADAGVFLDVDEELWKTSYSLDGGKINQVLLNLLLNAMKFRRSRIEMSLRRQGRQLVFAVKDDGEGIPAVHRDRLFDHRFQGGAKNGFPVRGHGIGLAGAQALLQAMNGRLRLESDGRRFTCFYAVLECVPEAAD